MSEKIRVIIVGYGNLGRGVEQSLAQNPDMELAAIVSRRTDIKLKTPGIPLVSMEDAKTLTGVDVCLLCGGSATDLWDQGPRFAEYFNTVDSFDTHARVPEYFETMDAASSRKGRLSIISVGWDPGLFSIQRLYAETVMPVGNTESFWGRGVSQGHSNAIRCIDGVKHAVQYTIPMEEAIAAARGGKTGLTARQKHQRECFVVLQPDADAGRIENEIKTMKNYFADYDTTVNFISEEDFLQNHLAMPQGGLVVRNGVTADGSSHTSEYSLRLESNPAFTSSILTAYARAAVRMSRRGQTGARTVFDVPPAMLSPYSGDDLRRRLL